MTFRQNRLPRALDRFRDDTGVRARRAIVEELRRGMNRGDNPKVVARRIRTRVSNVALGRAMTIARTEMMVALWQATLLEFQRDPVVDGWQWMARLDGRTCLICRAMHGTRHTKRERIESHPNCRCAMAPIAAGFEPIADRDSGESAFRRLPAREQRRILGDARYAAYKRAGSLGAMVDRTASATWGPGRRIAPLRAA